MQWLKWFLKRFGAWVALAILTGVAVAISVVYWMDPHKPAAVGALFGLITTALLVGITFEYVRMNQRSLKLLQLQWKRQNELEVRFGVAAHNGKARVWVGNIGLPTIIIPKIVVRGLEGKPVTIHKNVIVTHGRKRRFYLPEKVWEGVSLMKNIEVTLHYESSSTEAEYAKVYTLDVDEGKVYRVRRGLRALWPVGCPKCNKFHGICMVTDGITTFARGKARQKKMEAELSASCPQHASQWMLTIEHVEASHREESPEVDE